MRLIVISGRSGSGKTTALQVLEDIGYYCVDNLPVSLLPTLAEQLSAEQQASEHADNLNHIAVGIDARNLPQQLKTFPEVYSKLQSLKIDCQIIYLDSNDSTLLERFSATRRKHPLSNDTTSLAEAIAEEERLLSSIEALSQLTVDTSNLSIHQLRDTMKQQIHKENDQQISILCQSFGFKHGTPNDADFVFDVRCLPNPYWNKELRELTGLDKEVQIYLSSQEACQKMLKQISELLLDWIPSFEQNNRSYLTVAIGCTGGQHRSVFIVEELNKLLSKRFTKLQTRHRELSQHH